MEFGETSTSVFFEKPFFNSMMQAIIDKTTKIAVATTKTRNV